MSLAADGKHILLIDLQDEWRESSAKVLKEHGFLVQEMNNYEYAPPDKGGHDLVILGCARLGAGELKLVTNILEHKEHLLVLITKVSWPSLRAVFLAGVSDVADKPYDPSFLMDIVNQTFNTIGSKS